MLSSHRVVIDGAPIRYVERPGTSGTTLVFVHGRCMSSRLWERQFASPALARYRLLAFDLPGHGQSGSAASYGLSDYAQTVLRFIEHLRLTDYVLVGLSLGGHVALQMVPELKRCSGVVALTVPLGRPMEPDRMYQPSPAPGRAYQPQPSPADVDAYARLLLRPDADGVPEFLIEDFHQTDPAVHDGLLQSVLAGKYEDERALIQRAPVPVALVVGADDQLHNLAYLDDPNPALWRGRPQRIGGAGHLVAWEQAEAVNRLLAEFIRDCSSPRA